MTSFITFYISQASTGFLKSMHEGIVETKRNSCDVGRSGANFSSSVWCADPKE